MKLLLRVFVVLLYILGAVFAVAVLTGGSPLIGQITGLIGGGLSGVFICTALVTIALCTKLISRQAHPRLFWSSVTYGLILMGVFVTPLVALPVGVDDANEQFQSTFGDGWNTYPAAVRNQFLDAPYTHSVFYFGYDWKPKYLVQRDVVFADHSGDPDHPYQLKFDVYYPREAGGVGKNATIIFIHGGGWIMGDKGMGLNKLEYFASQGYIVFDIQYRLLDPSLLGRDVEGTVSSTSRLTQPRGEKNLYGSTSIAEMVSDIGEFTKYIGNPANNRFGANLDEVVIMGQSAGSHLGGLVAFGYNHPWFAGNFSDALHIKGVALFYPPNNATEFFWKNHPMYRNTGLMPGSPEDFPEVYYYSTPSNLIDGSSPPCIIFHGTVDKMVPNVNSETILRVMHDNGRDCVKVRGYFGGHAHDMASFHNSVAVYFLERFLYLEVTSKV
ncbi:MAG: alpha/beta hydrolase fold domain-containing protein [Promethearchaeota archaeon]